MTTEMAARTMPGGRDAPLSRPRRWRLRLALLCTAAAIGFAADAGWIHAKAALAQVLLRDAWERTLASGEPQRPWPRADTRPVARLSAPSLERDQIVLAGDSGRVLAFGPGWAEASAAPGDAGVTVISGHRDTHFAWLRELALGDALRVSGIDGEADYVVTDLRVADSQRERIGTSADDGDTLLLVTCWPFDAVVAGGPLRYVVTARRVS